MMQSYDCMTDSAAKRFRSGTMEGPPARRTDAAAPSRAPVDLAAAADRPRPDEIRQELGRIVGSRVFRGSLRLTRFLTFVVETTLAGGADRIKAYTIAVEAFGRGSDFDAQNDPIVRVQAARLRTALARYYSAAGRNDQLIIALPRGSYVPTFRRRPAAGGKPPLVPSQQAKSQQAESGHRSDRLAELADRRRQLGHKLAVFHELVEMHRRQFAALAAEIASTRQTLHNTWALMHG